MGQWGVSQEAKKFCAKMFLELGNKTQQEVSGGHCEPVSGFSWGPGGKTIEKL